MFSEVPGRGGAGLLAQLHTCPLQSVPSPSSQRDPLRVPLGPGPSQVSPPVADYFLPRSIPLPLSHWLVGPSAGFCPRAFLHLFCIPLQSALPYKIHSTKVLTCFKRLLKWHLVLMLFLKLSHLKYQPLLLTASESSNSALLCASTLSSPPFDLTCVCLHQ